MNNKIFFYDSLNDKIYLYNELFSYLNNAQLIPKYIYTHNYFEIFANIILGIIYEKEIILLDHDLSIKEIKSLSITDIDSKYKIKDKKKIELQNILLQIKESKDSRISLFTSGTTGLPKKITHKISNIIRMVKTNSMREKDVWGFAYNPTHIAGIQVFFQALFNFNTLVNLFELNRKRIFQLIDQYNITNIGATPTFFRFLLPAEKEFKSVKKISYGGEKFDNYVSNEIRKIFPNAKVLNIYASTEAGTIFASNDDIFEIKDNYKNLIKIVDNELLIHCSLLGESQFLDIDDQWYHTGDIVELQGNTTNKFKIVSRKNEMINIGGYKVNPLEVELILNQNDKIQCCRVYARKNSILGSILVADIVSKDHLTEKNIREYLDGKLQSYKIPRLINFVDNLEQTRTGKIKRI